MIHLIAHRGKDNKKYGDNTYDAIVDALNTYYIAGIEIDVRVTKDNEFVLIHDSIINLVSDGSGFVNKMTLNDLYQYNFGTKDNRQKVTTLKEILMINTKKVILIEIKPLGDNYQNVLDDFYKLIKDSKLNIYISSFQNKIINYLYKKYPLLKVGLIIGYSINDNYLNQYDFNIVTINELDNINNKTVFIWGLKKNIDEIKKYEYNIYLITDYAKLLSKDIEK